MSLCTQFLKNVCIFTVRGWSKISIVQLNIVPYLIYRTKGFFFKLHDNKHVFAPFLWITSKLLSFILSIKICRVTISMVAHAYLMPPLRSSI